LLLQRPVALLFPRQRIEGRVLDEGDRKRDIPW
jgi:hypothetical protein